MNTLQAQLAKFNCTEQYYSLKPLSKLVLTDGAKFLNDVTPLVQDAAIAISYDDKLKNEGFLSVTIDATKNACKTTIDDGNGNVLYTQDYQSSDLPAGQYKLFATSGTMMLTSEY